MAHLLKQQPLDDVSLQQDFQHVVGMNLVKLWDASDQLGLRVQLVLGGLLFTQLAERHSFVSCGNATEEQGQELLKLLEAIPDHDAFPLWHSATASAAPTPQTASTATPTTPSASASASAGGLPSASAARTASHPPARAAAALPTSASPRGKNGGSASAAAPPSRLCSRLGTAGDAASHSGTTSESATADEPDFPEVGLMDVVPQAVQILMMQCLLPCLSITGDFGQLVYASWMRSLVLGVDQLIDSTDNNALAPNLHPHIQLAARMRPDPALPAFSMETPLRVAQALLQALAVLLPFLLTCPPPTPSPPKPVQSPDLDVDRPAKQPTILEQIIANSPSLPDAYKHHVGSHKNTGRPLPAGLPLQQKFDQASVQRLIVLIARSIMHMRQEQGWQDMFLAARLIIDPQAKLRVLGALRGLSQANKLSKGEILVINEIFHRKPGVAAFPDPMPAAAAAWPVIDEQAAAKAAAKKAKKQRQKLKAKEQASASVAKSHDAHTPSDEAQPLSQESSQLSMDLSESSPSAGQPQAEDRQAQNVDQQQQLDEAQGSSLSVSASLGDTAARENDAVDVSVELEALHLPSCDQATHKGQTDADFLQQLFCCPLTKATMVEPTIAADGHTYERSAIQGWLTHSRTSPVTGQPLSHTRLVSNQAARVAIASQLGRAQ